MKTEFSTLDIVKALEIPRERFREWLTRGYISPSIQEAKGQGTKALFNRTDVYMVAIFRYLIEIGIKREEAAKMIGQDSPALRDDKIFAYTPFLIYTVWSDGVRMTILGPNEDEGADWPEMVANMMKMNPEYNTLRHMFVINFEQIRKNVDTALESLG